MNRPSPVFAALCLSLGLAACRKDHVEIRGSLGGQAAAGDSARVSVWAVEAEREAPVQDGAFELKDLAPGPVTLQLRRAGSPVGHISIPALPAGTVLTLNGLRVDAASGRAFPSSVEMSGGKMITLNGVRMAPDGTLPDTVDATGTVLAVSDDDAALLVRTADAEMPDLRVVVTPGTQTLGPAGSVAAIRLGRGDTVRVQGATHRGYVVATRLTVPQRALIGATPRVEADADAEPGAEDGPARAERTEAPAVPVAAVPAAFVLPRFSPPGKGGGHGNGRGRGHGRKGKH
ncbi:MAG TPA: hypothetical protein VFE05_15935 [Longimicrobiaceae bacterium]|jgi:hypothetical protein|nr:hypothetical protein [Longimicrobiaceae bacterium]